MYIAEPPVVIIRTCLIASVIYYFVATAYDSAGDESVFSSEISYQVPNDPTLSLGTNASTPMLIQFPLTAGNWYELQASTDLKNWRTISQTDVSLTNALFQFSDPDAANYSARFYRVVKH